MQTFLPFPDFAESAAVLHWQHLGKQRVENYQILIALLEYRGWVNHTATRMWRDYEWCLVMYQFAICREWADIRGYRDTCWEKTLNLYFKHRLEPDEIEPPWLGDPDIHLGYQSNLVKKKPSHYRQFFPDVPDNLPYVWPEGRR